MKIGIIASAPGWHVSALQAALEQRGITAPRYSITRLLAQVGARPRVAHQAEALDDCAALLVRGIPTGSLEQVIFRVDVLHRLENLGVKVVNSATAIERTVDKFYTSTLLEDAGLPTPRTVVTERFEDALQAFADLGGDVVVKPLFGSEGVGMLRVNDPDLAHRVFRALELGRYVYYLQQYICHDNWDVRALVIGDQVVAAMRRIGGNWKTNVAQGARTQALRLSPEMERISLQAARLVQADYAGVDLVCATDGRCYVLEVNGIPGWRGLQATTDLDIAGAIVEHVLRPHPQPLSQRERGAEL
jgi:RimK family alpha-L-glutamate ligase